MFDIPGQAVVLITFSGYLNSRPRNYLCVRIVKNKYDENGDNINENRITLKADCLARYGLIFKTIPPSVIRGWSRIVQLCNR